jgi:tetrahydromethanopterin S-methyltransferase subunit H
MLKFLNKQSTLTIGNVQFGGQPGKRRTVMVGSLFYPRHSIVEDRVHGTLRQGSAERLLGEMQSASDETGCPVAIMLYAETAQSIQRYLDRIPELFGGPIFIDSPSPEVRIAGIRRARQSGIEGRVIYNTINAGVTEQELCAIKDNGIKNAVLLAFHPGDIQAKGKIYLLENGGGILPEGLIELAQRYGVTNPLIDMAVMASEQGAGAALRGIMICKAKWGLPTGCAMHNAVESYAPLAKLQGEERRLFRYVDTAATAMPIMAGADFVMYGPIESGRRSMHAAAFADRLMEQASTEI